jgi:hypothetical protein
MTLFTCARDGCVNTLPLKVLVPGLNGLKDARSPGDPRISDVVPGLRVNRNPADEEGSRNIRADRLAIIRLHTVFEHHQAMTPVALEAFLHEYRIRFPVAVDEPSNGSPVPKTMAAYKMNGAPTLLGCTRRRGCPIGSCSAFSHATLTRRPAFQSRRRMRAA